MDVTVAVVPRERFRFLERSLKSLFETIPADVPVIVVDGGAPNKVLNAIKNLQKIRPFELIETHEFVLPNRARNIALKKVETKYIAFCDNDLEHSPNWLEALVESAEKHQAAAVAPTTLIGPTQTPRIHHAGGTLKRVYDDEGRVSLVERHNFANVPLSEAIENGFEGAPEITQNFEYHCVLFNTQVLRDIGAHDERMNTAEHIDTSLRLMANGHKIAFASESVVLYRAFERFTSDDWPYFHYRWALHRAVSSRKIFADNWGLRKDNITENSVYAAAHRRRAIAVSGIQYPKFLPKISLMARGIRWLNKKMANRHDGKLPNASNPYIPSSPPQNGLDLAGVDG